MKYRRLGNSGIDVSVIGHGTWGFGNDFFGEVDESEAVKSIHASLDSGVNLIDTAAAYGEDNASEKLVGKALEGKRDKAVLATKTGVLRFYGNYVKCLDPAIMRIELERSLKNLMTDYIDVYFIHWPEYNNGIEPALNEMVKFKKEGKIRAIGVSNFSAAQIQTAIDIADISVVQPPLNLLNRDSIDNGIIPFCNDKNVGLMTYGSLGGGILTGKINKKPNGVNDHRASFYPYYNEPIWSKVQALLDVLRTISANRQVSVAEVSINWVLAQYGVTSALMGSKKPSDVLDNVKAADWELSSDELKKIEDEYQHIFL